MLSQMFSQMLQLMMCSLVIAVPVYAVYAVSESLLRRRYMIAVPIEFFTALASMSKVPDLVRRIYR